MSRVTSIWRSVIRDSENIKKKIKEKISSEEFCLHFDGKRINGEEFQAVCLTNESRSLFIGVLTCESGSANDIRKPLEMLLDEYDAWSSIKMIISDTTRVNTGCSSGVVAQLNQCFENKGFNKPQFIGCQHHILDTILRHVLNKYFHIKSQSPNMNYPFIDEIQEKYEHLKANYSGEEVIPYYQEQGWRDDFRFLYDLCKAYQFHKTEGKWPFIKWHKLPSLHNARWNSRGIYTLIAYFLLPNLRKKLDLSCSFIAGGWSQAWFCDQKFSESRYEELYLAIKKVKCKEAQKSFETFWSRERSVLDVPRTNIIAERGVKRMEEVYKTCRNIKYLSPKFIAQNKQLDD